MLPLILIVLTVFCAFMNGFTDAPNSLANCVMTRCLPPKTAMLIGAVSNFLGVIISAKIAKSVSQTVFLLAGLHNDNSSAEITAICCSILSVIMFATLAWYFAIPTSESHALIAAVSGASFVLYGKICTSAWCNVISGVILSVVLGFVVSFCLSSITVRLMRNVASHKANNFFKNSQIVSAVLCAVMHGVQDGVKLCSIILIVLPNFKHSTIIIGCAMSTGTLFGAGRIMKNVGEGFARLKLFQGANADFASFISLSVSTVLGLPVSTSHIKTSALCGSAAQKNIHRVNWKTAGEMLLAWIITFPFCFLLSYILTAIIIRGN